MILKRSPFAGVGGLGNFIDDIITGAAADATAGATSAAGPLLDSIEGRMKPYLIPLILFTGGSFLIGLATYRKVSRK